MPKPLLALAWLVLSSAVWAQEPLDTVIEVRHPELRNIIFKGGAEVVSAQEQDKIAEQIRKLIPRVGANGAADAAPELVREAYQNKGYFKVEVERRTVPAGAYPSDPVWDLILSVREGQQYRLASIRWRNVREFPEQQLRDLMPIGDGDFFDRSKIARGLDAVQKLYDTGGFINFTSVPETKLDEANTRIYLIINVDEGKLFRWGDLRITGLDETHTQALLRAWGDMHGKPSLSATLSDFFAKFVLPVQTGTNLHPSTGRWLDEKTGTVDVIISFPAVR
jgi:outer membrane protein assembly factor BamA